MSLQSRLALLVGRVSKEFVSIRTNAGLSRRMQPWHLALASQSVAPANIYAMGDSVFEGAVCSALSERALNVMERGLRSSPGGEGYKPAWTSSPFVSNPATYSTTPVNAVGASGNPPVVYDQLWTALGFGAKRIGLQKSGWVEWSFVGNRVRVWYDRTNFFGLSADVIIDGTVVARLDGGGADDGAVSWLSDNLGHGQHTVRIKEPNDLGGAFWVEGIQALSNDSSSGVHVFDGSRSGNRAEDYTAANPPWSNAMAKVSPSLVLMMFGFNDMNQRTPAQFKSDLTNAVSRVRAKLADGTYTLAIVAPWSPAPGPAAGWNAYVTAMEEVAAAHPYGVCIRIIDRWPVMVAGGGNSGMFGNDTVHPSESGQRLLGQYLATSLGLSKRSGPSGPTSVWTDAVLTNGWQNYGGSYPSAQFLVTPDGRVHLRGMVRNGTDSQVLQLPAYAAPAGREIFSVSGRNSALVRVDVTPSGSVDVTMPTVGDWAPLNGISWSSAIAVGQPLGTATSGVAASAHTHQIKEVVGLEAELQDKADVSAVQDTGWVPIPLQPDWVGQARVRRNGNHVLFHVTELDGGAVGSSLATLAVIPPGFRAPAGFTAHGVGATSSSTAVGAVAITATSSGGGSGMSENVRVSTPSAWKGGAGSITWYTDEPRPSSQDLAALRGDGAQGGSITRLQIVARSARWFPPSGPEQVPYSRQDTYPDGDGHEYRADCSGFISMALHADRSYSTRSLGQISVEITKDQLLAGDYLLSYDNHVVLFLGWTDETKTRYHARESSGPKGGTIAREIPYPYFEASSPETYVPMRYVNST